MNKLSWVNKELKFSWLADFGNYNKMPRPFQELSEGEFWYQYRSWVPLYIEDRQIHDLIPNEMKTLQIFWFSDCGLAIQFPDKWDYKPNLHYVDKPKFYRIGCEHSFEELPNHTGWRCYHTYKCQICGHTYSVDSSD